ncbi:MAG: glycosyltransferase N-terminal domain-containing protein [Bacteroidales bacterium]
MYSIAINIVFFFLRIVGLWNEKVRLFVKGRKELLDRIEAAVKDYDDIIWFHTASYGDFEEARPIVDATRKAFPERKILLTFFSPSGYEARKTYKSVDWVFYLPMDTKRNAGEFLRIVRPVKAIFTIGEYWRNYLTQLKMHNVDTYVMSVRILPDSPYLKWYGAFYRNLFRNCYKNIIVKDAESVKLLKGIGAPNVTHVGDARFDRVIDIASEPWHNSVVESWACGRKVFVAGSTCPGGDDDLVIYVANKHPEDKFLFIPHEIEAVPIKHITDSVRGGCVIYSDVEKAFEPDASSQSREAAEKALSHAQALVIDKVGMLSKLYRYGFASLVGGAFINMPHSVIEPAVYGLPVAMGPQYERDLHFVDMLREGAAVSVKTGEELDQWYVRLKTEPAFLSESGKKAIAYCASNKGATETIMHLIFG